MFNQKTVRKMKILSKVVAIAAFLGIGSMAFAQQRISGTVNDSMGPVVGASVFVEGNNSLGTITDVDGKYSLSVPENSTIIVSCIGYADQTAKVVAGKAVYDFTLAEDAEFLEETVVIGYQTVKRRDLTGSVSSVNSKQLAAVPVANVAQAMQGKLAGVNVVSQDGRPDAGVSIRVRGGGSISQSNDPLVLIDGVAGTLSDIPSDQVESIDVLKDASSTAIYGARGANGVILVTTKGAKEGKVRVNYSGYAKFNTPTKYLDNLGPYDYLAYVWANADAHGSDYIDPFTKLFGIGTYGDINAYKNVDHYDVQKKVYHNSFSHSHDLSIGGGSETTKVLFSVNYNDEQGMKVNSYNKRANVSLKVDQKLGNKVTVGLDARYTDVTTVSDESAGNNNGSLLSFAYRFRPIALEDIKGDHNAFRQGAVEQYGKYPLWEQYDPYNRIMDSEPLKKRQHFRGTASLNWEIIKGLSFHTELSMNRTYNQNKTWNGPIASGYLDDATGEANWAGTVNVTKGDSWGLRWTNTLNYDFNIGKANHFNILLGHEVSDSRGDSMNIKADHFPSNFTKENAFYMINQYDPDSFAEKNPFSTSYSIANRMLSYFGRLNYTLLDRYLLTVTFRADGSSKFAPSNKWGYFPAGAFAWRISEEPWMKNVNWIDDLKFRASYGSVGNDGINANLWSQLWASSTSKYSIENNLNTSYGLASTTMANTDLKWETTITRNLGLDFGFFKGRLNGTVDVYWNTTKDLLMNTSLPGFTGFTATYANIGQTSNKGVEFSLNGTIVETRDWGLTAGFNINFNKNNVDMLADGVTGIYGSGWFSAGNPGNDYCLEVGKPVGLVRGLIYEGYYTPDDFNFDPATNLYTLKEGVQDVSGDVTGMVYGVQTPSGQTAYPGLAKFKDVNGDGTVSSADYTVIGNMNPKHTGGFHINATYKGFDLGLYFNWSAGNQVYNINRMACMLGYKETAVYQNKLSFMKDAYKIYDVVNNQLVRYNTPEEFNKLNANAQYPLCYNENGMISTLGIEDGSYLRLNTATLGYSLPSNVCQKIGMNSLRIYGTVYNLFTLTKYSGLDPEVNTGEGRATYPTPGLDWGAYPRARSFVIGVNVSF